MLKEASLCTCIASFIAEQQCCEPLCAHHQSARGNAAYVLRGRGRTHRCLGAQVENLEALHNFDSIAGAADAVILSRGNLGLDVAPEKTAVVQKAAINRCNLLVCLLHHITAAWCGCDSSVCD